MDLTKLDALSNDTLIKMKNYIDSLLIKRNVDSRQLAWKTFKYGDYAMFKDKQGGSRMIKLTRINGKSASGVEVDPITRVESTKPWRVSLVLLTLADPPTTTEQAARRIAQKDKPASNYGAGW